MTDKITFKKVTKAYKENIFFWLSEPHIQEFWDNTQGHKDDILNFMDGRKEPSSYCDGKYIYWIAFANNQPYALLMTIQETHKDDVGTLKTSHLSKTGNTYGIDYMIGNFEYLGKGYGARTLIKFINFLRAEFDKKADTFFIYPANDNSRAKRVYEKAGFNHVADFIMGGNSSGSGKTHHLLTKKFSPTVTLETVTFDEYPMIQNMARFYVYDLSKSCGHISDDWCLPDDGLFESFDFKKYFEGKSCQAYLIKVYGDIAGFVLLNQVVINMSSKWNMGEFFILARYQGYGVGKQAAEKVWQLHPGKWELSVIPENTSALIFWESTIKNFTGDSFKKETRLIDFDNDQPRRVIFNFESNPAIVTNIEDKQPNLIKGINHVNISVNNIDTSFAFYKDVLGFKPLCKSEGNAYFLIGAPDTSECLWFSLDLDRNQIRKPSPCNTHIAFTVEQGEFDEIARRILTSGSKIFKENTSPGKSLYFLDPDEHKLEIHVGTWQDRIMAKKENPGNWKNIEWYV